MQHTHFVEHPLEDLEVTRAAAASALAAVGIDAGGLLGAAYLHAATDVLLAVTIAGALPAGASFEHALSALSTFVTPQPLPVLQAQLQLLQGLMKLRAREHAPGPVQGPSQGEVAGRLEHLAAMLQHDIRTASTSVEGELE